MTLDRDDNDTPIVQHAADQRQRTSDDEPCCGVCGRYGAYICDATDDDVCSIECRDICMLRQREALVLHHEQAKQQALEATRLRRRLGIRVVVVTGTNDNSSIEVPSPVQSFADCALPPQLLANLSSSGFDTPTPVQMQVLPCILQRHNVFVIAPTGSGKTAAFLIPILTHLATASDSIALVLAPVRELAMQLERVAKQLAAGIASCKTALLVGGFPLPPQRYRLSTRGVQLLVATPGRCLELFTSSSDDATTAPLLLRSLAIWIIDEVDLMLASGFEAQIRQIYGLLQSSPAIPTAQAPLQLVCVSATSSSRVESLVQQLLQKNDTAESATTHCIVRIDVDVQQPHPNARAFSTTTTSTPTTTLTINPRVHQTIEWATDKHKKQKLFAYLTAHRTDPTLVFVRSKAGADLLAHAITQHTQRAAASIHSDKSQPDRLAALEAFVHASVDVLVATNVLSRGIDLLDVARVVVFDLPPTVADYVHLIGRTGRRPDADGFALTLLNDDDHAVFCDLVALLRSSRNRKNREGERIEVPHQVYARLAVDLAKERAAAHAQAHVAVTNDATRAFRIVPDTRRRALDATPLASASWREWTDSSSSSSRSATMIGAKKPRRA